MDSKHAYFDNQVIEEVIHASDETIKELLEVQSSMRKAFEAYKARYERQSEEINSEIDLQQQYIKQLKSKLK